MSRSKALSTFGLPGKGMATVALETAAEATQKVRWIHEAGIPVIPSGAGTNCVFLEPTVPAIFLKSADRSVKVVKKGATVTLTVGAGHDWDDLVRHAVKNGWRGIERLSGIPGTVGAAPVQNIGAYGSSLSDVFVSARCLNLATLKLMTLDAPHCGFGYRTSIFNTSRRGELLIVSITLRLRAGGPISISDHAELRNSMPMHPSLPQVRKAILAIRKRKLPDHKTLPNCGSFFKNPIVGRKIGNAFLDKHPDAPHWPEPDGKIKLSAAWLIDRSGVRSKHWGKISISPQHSLVLMNRGEKNHARLKEAIRSITSAVSQKFSIALFPEPNLLDASYAENISKVQFSQPPNP